MQEHAVDEDATVGSGRLARGVATFLLGAHGAMLLGTVPLLALMVLSSLWEGGDEALKQRLQAWGPVSGFGNLVAAVLLCSAAVAVHRRSSDTRTFLAVTVALVLALAAGWAWVWQRVLLTDPSQLMIWLVLTCPGPLAAGLSWRQLRRTGIGDRPTG